MRIITGVCGSAMSFGLCAAAVYMACEKSLPPSSWGWFLTAGVGLFLVVLVVGNLPDLNAPREYEEVEDVPAEPPRTQLAVVTRVCPGPPDGVMS